MSASVFDLSARRDFAGPSAVLAHPAGVTIPLDSPVDSQLITPQIRSEIVSGTYSRDMISLLPDALRPGDRVLVIGAGLGVLASLVAQSELAERIIAVEANPALVSRLRRVKSLNGADQIEPVLGVLGNGLRGSVPFFIGRDFRDSSVVPGEGRWSGAIRVPALELNLILAEERVSAILCDVPDVAPTLFARADLSRVDRLLLRLDDRSAAWWQEGGLCSALAAQGFDRPERPEGCNASLFHRITPTSERAGCTCGAANRHGERCVGPMARASVHALDARAGNVAF